ncbi:MAG: PEFG-CTERM sorting domain-containing protein [Nitrosopumilus sp.]|nr:PEFG-CTERM sorting domain-containing protein [Nitrosopumilus sp.]
MKIHSKPVFSIMAFFVMVMILSTTQAFAENVIVSTPQGTSVPGCETTNECYIPYEVTVDVGGEVTWSNDDSAAHTVTAGSAADGPSGVFDSSLFMAGTTFSHKFEAEGKFPYFCMVHPWMEGIVLVGTTKAKEPKSTGTEMITTESAMGGKETITLDHEITGGKITHIIPDTDSNSLIIGLDSTAHGQITVPLPRDVIDAKIGDEDDDFFVIVDGEEVDFDETTTSTDRTLVISFPAGAEEIEIVGTFVIPEFGTVAAMILVIAIISIIAISSKSKLSIMPRF